MSTPSIFDNSQDIEALRAAVARLEAPSLTIRLANFIRSPIEMALDRLPRSASEKIQQAVHAALNKAVAAALWSMDKEQGSKPYTKTHSAVAAASGAVGGFFGLAGTLIELPV